MPTILMTPSIPYSGVFNNIYCFADRLLTEGMNGSSFRFLRPSSRSLRVASKPVHARFFSASQAYLSKSTSSNTEQSNDYQKRVKQLRDHGDLADYYPRLTVPVT